MGVRFRRLLPLLFGVLGMLAAVAGLWWAGGPLELGLLALMAGFLAGFATGFTLDGVLPGPQGEFRKAGENVYSFMGCGTSLWFYRSRENGLYEATNWMTLFFVPIVPGSTWIVRPVRVVSKSDGDTESTTYFHEWIERRRTRFLRLVWMYGLLTPWLALCFGPAIGIAIEVYVNNKGLTDILVSGALFPLLILGPALASCLCKFIHGAYGKLYPE